MFFVTLRNTDTGEFRTERFERPGYDNEREAMRLIGQVELMTNLALVTHNVDVSKFRV